MKGIRLLLKNSFRSARRNLAQIIGLSALVMIVSLVSSLLSATTTRVVDAYENLKIESNQRQAIMVHNMNAKITGIDSEDHKKNLEFDYEGSLTKDTEFLEQFVMNQLALKYNFEWTRTEGRMTNSIIGPTKDVIKVKSVIKTNSKDLGIDQLVVSKGRMFETKDEVVISESFAKRNNIKLGDIIRVQIDEYGKEFLVKESNPDVAKDINGKSIEEILQVGSKYQGMIWYEVVGFGSSADFATPLIDETSVIADTSREVLVYMKEDNFGFVSSSNIKFLNKDDSKIKDTRAMYSYDVSSSRIMVTSEYDREIYFSIKFNNKYNKDQLDELEKYFGIFSNTSSNEKQFFDLYDPDYKFVSRVTTFDMVIKAYEATSAILMAVILIIASFTIILITKKQVEAQSKQIGTLKALGYKKREVVNNFICVPLIVSLIGSICGYIFSIFIAGAVVKGFTVYFNVAFYGFKFDLFGFLGGILFVWILLTIISFAVGYWVIRQTALTLLKGGDDRAINKFGVGIKKIYSKTRFDTRLRASLLTTSVGKLAGVSATMLLGTTLLTTTVIAPKVMKDNMEATFRGMKYENITEYVQPLPNNPLSFYKTYNPEFSDNENKDKFNSWGYQKDKIDKYALYNTKPTNTVEARVAYPLKEDNSINIEKIFNDVIKGNISNEFWSFEIANDSPYSWSKMSYLNWKNLSIDYLKYIDLATFDIGGIAGSAVISQTINQIQDQWPDFTYLISELKKFSNNNPNEREIKDFTELFLWFYTKYTTGLNLTFNPKIVNEQNKINFRNLNNNMKESGIFRNRKGYLYKEYWDVTQFTEKNIENIFKPKEDSKTTELLSTIDNSKELKEIVIEDLKEKELKKLNASLVLWFSTVVDYRLNMALLQTTYSRSPYFLQELIKDAWNNNKNYNISFNTVPFIPGSDELGTKINSTFKTKNNKVESINLYGLNKNTKLVNLEDRRGNNLLDDLFNFENKLEIPIIINQTTSIKSGKNSGDLIDLTMYKELLADNNMEEINLNTDVELGYSESNNKFMHQGASHYYSLDSSFSDHTPDTPIIPGIPTSFTPGSIKGNYITKEIATKATQQTDIHKSFSKGEINIINEIIKTNKKIRIVGVQDGYGQPQAWINNEIANELMGYDKVKKFNFEKWFIQEYGNLGNEFYNEKVFGKNVSRIKELDSFMKTTIRSNSSNIYEDFLLKINEAISIDDSFVKMNTYFENLYPIFNYKYSSKPNKIDLDYGFSSSQRLGDFSSQGLNGNYEYIEMECDDENGEQSICLVPDPNNFVEGYGIGTLGNMMPMEQTRQILGQITDIVNMIIIMFIIIALLVSSTIILLATSLVIYENKQFIATMKTLGYSNGYIVRQILGIYVVAILVMFAIGIGIGWLLFKYTATYLALNTAWVLPVTFGWWIPFAVFAILAAIYVLTFITSWNAVLKINPVESLKVKD